ncbi:MAG TPA: ABC transporter permease, partial [Tepidisphaeraceae bacterium]
MSIVDAGATPAGSLTAAPSINWRDWLKLLRPLIGLLFVFTVFSVLTPRTFLTAFNLRILLEQTTIVGIAALGMTMIIVSGGIDLSVGSNVAFCTIVTALLLNNHLPPSVAALGGIAGGLFVGVVIGSLITAIGLSPFIVTLGIMGALRGFAIGASGKGGVVYPPDEFRDTWIGSLLRLDGTEWYQFIPVGAWFLLALALIVAG